MHRLFLSYHFHDEEFVSMVYSCLSTQQTVQPFLYTADAHVGRHSEIIATEIDDSSAFVLFCGKHAGQTQLDEVDYARQNQRISRLFVKIEEGEAEFNPSIKLYRSVASNNVLAIAGRSEDDALYCARGLCGQIGVIWMDTGRLPKYLFHYEKDVISKYVDGGSRFPSHLVRRGCPPTWPRVRQVSMDTQPNPIPEAIAGSFRHAEIRVDARMSKDGKPFPADMKFPEAGPRKEVLRGPNPLRAAILVSRVGTGNQRSN